MRKTAKEMERASEREKERGARGSQLHVTSVNAV